MHWINTYKNSKWCPNFQVYVQCSALSANSVLFSPLSNVDRLKGLHWQKKEEDKKSIIMEECIVNKITSRQFTMGERVHWIQSREMMRVFAIRHTRTFTKMKFIVSSLWPYFRSYFKTIHHSISFLFYFDKTSNYVTNSWISKWNLMEFQICLDFFSFNIQKCTFGIIHARLEPIPIIIR